MSLFQCENCGCVENTALSSQGFSWTAKSFDWSYAPERRGMMLCSACGPTHYRGGEKADDYGRWHGRFKRVFLPKGMFHTNERGNLAHNETGDEEYSQYEIS